MSATAAEIAALSRRALLRASAVAGGIAALGSLPERRSFAQIRTEPRGPQEADFVFRGGAIFTAEGKPAEAVAVRNGTISYVGSAVGADDLVGRSTRTIDLDGKLLLPGFVEGQIHPILGAALVQGVNVQYATRQETLDALKAWRDRVGSVGSVRGYGWCYSAFGPYGPSKSDLDPLWPDTPVVLLSVDMRAAWANSTALERAGIVRGVHDPIPGLSFFQRDAGSGEPTGYVIGLPAVLQLVRAAMPIDSRTIAAALEGWLARAAAEGITSLFDAGIEVVSDKEGLSFYESLEQTGRLPCRIVACHLFNHPEIDPMPKVRQLRDRSRTGLVRAGALKIALDGTESHYTAALLEPYADWPSARGGLVINASLLRDTVMRADAEGFDVVIKTTGDRAVRIALDAIEAAARANGRRGRRHALTHLGLIADEDLPRFAQLDVIAQFCAQSAVPDAHWQKITLARLGPERAGNGYRLASLLRDGTTVAFGTDWPMAPHGVSFRPLDAIEVAVTRRQIGQPQETALSPADEALTLEQAVIANTLGAARLLRLDDQVGSIAVGKRADLVVLDRDIFKMAPHQIHEAKVLMTLMNGAVRYERASALTLPVPLPDVAAPVALTPSRP
ncbi:amidohydrolase [Enhydrobacter aerosaccus]|nr:amidohydrolase [Enhydrobacter aerosaccus]